MSEERNDLGYSTSSNQYEIITEKKINAECRFPPHTNHSMNEQLQEFDYKAKNIDTLVNLNSDKSMSDEGVQSPITAEVLNVENMNDDDPSDLENEPDFPFPPVLFRKKTAKGEQDEEFFAIKTDNDGDDKNYVECGEEGMCKCQKIRASEYYDYYIQVKDREYYTMYPKGKCILPKGTILHFTGATKYMTREHFKEALTALGAKIEFIDYQRGDAEGWIRLSYPHEARVITKKMNDKKLKIAEADIVFRVISGKEEKKYLKKTIDDIYKVQEKSKSLAKMLKKAGFKYV